MRAERDSRGPVGRVTFFTMTLATHTRHDHCRKPYCARRAISRAPTNVRNKKPSPATCASLLHRIRLRTAGAAKSLVRTAKAVGEARRARDGRGRPRRHGLQLRRRKLHLLKLHRFVERLRLNIWRRRLVAAVPAILLPRVVRSPSTFGLLLLLQLGPAIHAAYAA